MENKDLLGIGQAFGQSIPIKKLLSILEKFGGRLFKPVNDVIDTKTDSYRIKQMADAKAYEIVTLNKAETSALVERSEAERMLLQKASDRLVQQEIRRQENIDAINQIAFDEIKDEANVSDAPVSEDWAARFFSIAQDISDVDMRQLWGKILSGEVKEPNSYSVRTLDVLKNINKAEAEIFSKFVRASVRFTGGLTGIVSSDSLEKIYDISFIEKLAMQEVGLIATENNLQYTVGKYDVPNKTGILHGNKGLLVSSEGKNMPMVFQIIKFTTAALELLKIIHVEANEDILKAIGHSIKMPESDRIIKLGAYIDTGGGNLIFPVLQDV